MSTQPWGPDYPEYPDDQPYRDIQDVHLPGDEATDEMAAQGDDALGEALARRADYIAQTLLDGGHGGPTDYDVRAQALAFAVHHEGSDKAIVERAGEFYKFLKGEGS